MSPGLVMPPPLSKDEHPLARFWKKSDWEKWKKRQKETKEPGRRRRGQGMNSSWMEQEDGQRVGDERQQAILRVARQTWVTMRSYKIPFGPFLDTPRPTTDYFAATLESTFLELRLCEDHWKVRRLWMENFSSWNNHRSPEGPETASHHPSTSTAPLYPSTSAVPQHPTEGPQEVPQSEPQSEKVSWFPSHELHSDTETVRESGRAKETVRALPIVLHYSDIPHDTVSLLGLTCPPPPHATIIPRRAHRARLPEKATTLPITKSWTIAVPKTNQAMQVPLDRQPRTPL